MANLNVQPKSPTPWWIWLLLLLIGAGIIYYVLLKKDSHSSDKAVTDSALVTTDTSLIVAATEPDWDNIDFNVPGITYSELSDTDIVVRGKDNYSIYALGENIIFNKDESTLQKSADDKLSQISGSLKKRFEGSKIGVFGGTDATGSAYHNAKLGERRAETVKNWLVTKGGIEADRLSVHSMGEKQPIADNTTTQGRQQNRNVQIVVFKNLQ